MLETIEGTYEAGRVELRERPVDERARRVLVTFLPDEWPVSLREHGIGREQAAELRRRLSAFETDWDRPDMDAYDAL
ncbi:MAG: hypothetical protein FJX72_05265 [Armatimonadetes bacterium]|nr:hypothetical protein [Armatimonadota bacterium]